ncbi:hypothetical protein F4861DRAFT_173790 [Xylaria intraflava]|nr:hypothetical protein F4861DRAFT_173790 [Xylaria intraflava]
MRHGCLTVPLYKRPDPARKPIIRSNYKFPKPVKVVQRTYLGRKKIEVLLFLKNHRIPLERNIFDLLKLPPGCPCVHGESPVEYGYRKPFLREASDCFKVPKRTILDWRLGGDKILGEYIPKRYSPPYVGRSQRTSYTTNFVRLDIYTPPDLPKLVSDKGRSCIQKLVS